MHITRTFFVREIVRLRHSIASIERGLNSHNSADPRLAGQRAMLDNERRCREVLLDLAAEAADVVNLQMTLRLQYAAAKKAHEQHRYHQPGQAVMGDDWWETLGRMQYLCHLHNSLQALMRDFTQEERQAEIERVTRHKDVASAAERAALFHAIANAEGSASDKEYLVRHDVRRYNGASPNGDKMPDRDEPPPADNTAHK